MPDPIPPKAPDKAGLVERLLESARQIREHVPNVDSAYRVLAGPLHADLLEEAAAALSPPPVVEEADPEADLVARFSAALLAKLRSSEQKYGWQRGWLRNDWSDELPAKLLQHVHKGDPIDVAAYAAFAWHHGWSVAPTPTAGEEVVEQEVQAIIAATGGKCWQDSGAVEAVRIAFRRGASFRVLPIPDELRELTDALEWFGEQRGLELSFYQPIYGDDDDLGEEWRVDRVSGGINDREWATVGRGETPILAILSARQALKKESSR